MTESEWITNVLSDAKNAIVALTKDTPSEYRDAFRKALAYKLIIPHGNTYRLDEAGYLVLEIGGFDIWREMVHKKTQMDKQPSITVRGNAVFGDNNSGIALGAEGVLINTGDNAHISSNIETKKGNFEALAKKLRDSYVLDEDITELKSLLEMDSPNEERRTFGEKVNGWISKMIIKSLDGSWAIGIGTAGNLLADAIKAYYGWH
ncbi:hypothetical protein GCM10023189_03570 [Nibrella saemangeumensis]|uniref:Uncharacterized protein n=1 Tax=Nibrella saemangeumensis TaxID=1084526 RepID=A0ABP8MB32_9BACT